MNDDVKQTVAILKGIPTQKKLVESLEGNVMEVTFTKANGDRRVMTCTQSRLLIPKDKRPKPLMEGAKPKPADLITVWDVLANGWRSFKYDRVSEVKHQSTDVAHEFHKALAEEVTKEIDEDILKRIGKAAKNIINHIEEK
jgi:hypothetical protein